MRLFVWSALPLWLRLVLLVNGLLVVAVTGSGVLTYGVAHQALRNEIITSGKGATLDFATLNALEFLDEQAGRLNLELRLAQLMRGTTEKRLVAAEVLTRDGKLLAAVGQAAAVDFARLSRLDAPEVIDGDSEGITCASPVSYDGVPLGFVVFHYSSAALDAAAEAIMVRSGSIVGALVLLTSALFVFMLRRLMRPVVELGHAAEAFARGDYGHRIALPENDDEISRAARSFNSMCDALELHMRFSNAALVDRIRHGGTDEAREYQLTIAFGDAQSYTQWSQHRTPQEIFATLTRYFTCVGRIAVLRHNGIIDKFMGDGVMIHFGLRREASATGVFDSASARDAVRAIITVQLALRVLSWSIRTLEGREPLNYRFGVASGRCVVGPVGARDVMLDYSLIGNVVNLASRLEGKAVASGLLVDRFTFIDAGTEFVDVVDRGDQELKGVAHPIRVYSVRNLKQAEEIVEVRRFLLDEFLQGEVLDDVFLNGKATPEKRKQVRDYARDLLERDSGLPV